MRKRSWLQTSKVVFKLPVMAIYGGIDLGGTKIQAAVVDEGADNTVLGAQARSDAAQGRPEGDRQRGWPRC